MYTTSVLCYRTRPPLYISFNGSPCSFPDPQSRQYSCSCCCSCCCALSVRCGGTAGYGLGLDFDPLLAYGLRQSSLLRRPAARSVVLAGGSGCVFRYPAYRFDGEVWDGFGGPSLGGRREGRNGAGRRRIKCTVSDEDSGSSRFSRVERAEALISLLSDELGEESLGFREREGGLGDQVLVRKKKKKEGGVRSNVRTQYLGTDRSKSQQKCRVKSIEISATERDERKEKKRGKGVSSRHDNHGTRREGSSFSSYHSVLSSGEYEDDVEINHDEFSTEASGKYNENSRKAAERKVKVEVLEGDEQHEEKKKKRSEVIQKRNESESSFIDWDVRKKSEKKLSEISTDELECCMKSVQEKSTLKAAGQEDVGSSNSQLQYRSSERKSNLGVNIKARTGNLHDHKETAVRIVGGPANIGEASEVCSFCGNNVKFSSQSGNEQSTRRKEDVAVSGAFAGERINEWDGKKVVKAEREKLIRNPHVVSVELDAGGANSEMTTESSRNSEARVNSSMVEEKHRRSIRMNEVVHGEKQLLKSEQSSEYKESHHGIQRVPLPQLNNSEDCQKESQFASGLNKFQNTRTPQRHPSEESSVVINQSLIDASDTSSFASFQSTSNETTINNNFTTVVVLAGETAERNNQTGGRVDSAGYKTEQDSVDRASSVSHMRRETSTSQDPDLVCLSDAPKVDRRDSKTPSHSLLIPPPSQLVQRESSPFGGTNVTASQEGYYVHNSHSSSAHMEGGIGSTAFHSSFDIGVVKDGRDDPSVMLTTDGRALESAIRSDEASRKFIGEFMEQTAHFANSDIHLPDSFSNDQEGFYGKTSFGEIVSESSQVDAQDKRNKGEVPGTKGPLDDIWHDTDTSIQEIPKEESLDEHIVSGNTIVRRSGRTLWRIIGDIFRVRWGNPHSMVHSGGRISSNISVSSETWLSGHEADERIDKNAKSRSNNKIPEAATTKLQPARKVSGDQVDTHVSEREWQPKAEISPPFETKNDSLSELPSTTSSLKDFTWNKDIVVIPPVTTGLSESSLALTEGGMTDSLGVTPSSGKTTVYEGGSLHVSDEISNMSVEVVAQEGKNGEKQKKMFQPTAEISPPVETKNGSSSELPSTTSSLRNFTWNKDIVVNPPVSTGLSESLLPLPEGGITGSLGVTSSSGKMTVYESGSLHGSDGSSNISVEVVAQEGKNGELKQRKMFQRKQQIPRDRFDEWEEAYKLEREQRQIDEMFMREALLEAKKAGDNWEVPVGAVLVQHGKIIARGCNLVEELRDSTAHAEMFCIREGSNVLKSWRLSETTLYVTLEPCTMCAGAILQARVDTLVWGAPNKLLGADGSYIRLFPVEDGGVGGSQVTDKPAPPVHPFHPKMTIRRGVLASDCADAMQQFFQLRRRKKGKKDERDVPTSGLHISHHPSKLLNKMHNIWHFMFCI
ncbi:hypothetical protein MLD38_007483 [Melastoma candidum]|uniref:Uncharacterized protein n=1 Tax=Melastoma candidum TaxID=119954 RepID=A0ACB9RZT7_9MYRT|nr:hypothetical protein MLD38_007483 [Melastoma candidum]